MNLRDRLAPRTLTVLVYRSRLEAVARVAQEPAASRRRMVPLYSGAVDGWCIEWRRADGRILFLARSGWAYIWNARDTIDYAPA